VEVPESQQSHRVSQGWSISAGGNCKESKQGEKKEAERKIQGK
jgi:hypothetical protein